MKYLSSGLVLAVVILYIVLSSSTYVLTEAEQAIVLQFGKPVGSSKTDAGLHFKVPFIQEVKKFEKRILEWDGDPNQIPTKDKKYIQVDITARWRIVDALKFYQTVRNVNVALNRLDDVIDGATRNRVASYNLVETVRNSNQILEESPEEEDEQMDEQGNRSKKLERITDGREHLAQEIFENSRETVNQFGIELIDIKIKRVNYEESVREKVYERMVSERTRIAEQFRSVGQGLRAEILGKMEKDLKEIESKAYKDSQEIKGMADAEAARIYANAYNKAPKFYTFLKSLETIEKVVKKETILFLSTQTPFLKLLKDTK